MFDGSFFFGFAFSEIESGCDAIASQTDKKTTRCMVEKMSKS